MELNKGFFRGPKSFKTASKLKTKSPKRRTRRQRLFDWFPQQTNRFSLNLLSLVAFLLAFQMALVLFVLAGFIKELTGQENVGVYYFVAYLAGVFVLLNLHHLVKKHGKSAVALLMIGFKALALVGMGIFAYDQAGIIFVVWSLMAGSLAWVSVDILIESFSSDNSTGSIRGGHLTVMNLGLLLAPALAAWIIESFGYHWLFFYSAEVTFFAWIIILIWFRKVNHNIREDLKLSAIFKKMLRRKNICRIYWIAFLLDLFYATTVIYVPIYLFQQGISILEMGKIFTIMLLPFVFLQYPLGRLADKKWGEKEMLVVGVLIMALFIGIMTFLESSWPLIWGVVLFMGRVGAAIVEVMRDSYFYKQVGPRDVDLIDLFRTTRSVSYISGTAIFSLVMVFFPLKVVFLVLAGIILTGIGALWKLEDTR